LRLPSFLETGRVVGSTYIRLSSRIVPFDFSYEITATELPSFVVGTITPNLWLIAQNVAVPAFFMVPRPPLLPPPPPEHGYEFVDDYGSRVGIGFAGPEDPYAIIPVGLKYTMRFIVDLGAELRHPVYGTCYPISGYSVEGMLGRYREMIVRSLESELILKNDGIGFYVDFYIRGTLVWSNYNDQIYLPVPLEQDKVPFKLTIFYGVHPRRDETLVVLMGLRPEPILIKLGGRRFGLTPYFCTVKVLDDWKAVDSPAYDPGECYVLFHSFFSVPPREFMFAVPSDLPLDLERSDVWNFPFEKVAAGTYRVFWGSAAAPLISKLVFGSQDRQPLPQVWLTHPVVEVSVNQSLDQTMITQEASLRLMPRRFAEWQWEKWLFKPLYEFFVSVDNQELFLGYRSRLSLQTESSVLIRGEVSLMDNRALLQRMTVDKPVNYDYWMATEAAADFLRRFGLGFATVAGAPDIQLLPEYAQEKSFYATWRPRLGETALDFLLRIAEVAGWRLDFTQLGTVYALPRWEPVGSLWFLVWPEQLGILTSDMPVTRMSLTIDDFSRRNILVVWGVDAATFADTIRVFADLEAFLNPASERFFPLAVPAFVKFDRPVPSAFLDRYGAWLAERLFVVPAEIQFQTPLNFAVRPGDRLRFLNPTEADLHRYELVVTSVRHEIGRELTTFVGAKVYRQISF